MTRTESQPHTDAPLAGEGTLAPDFRLVNQRGEDVALSDTWTSSPAIVVFLRSFGCAFCKLQALELREHYQELRNRGVTVVCVAMGPYQAARGFQILYDLPFDILVCGDDASPYRAFGLTKLTISEVIRLRSAKRIISAALHGIFNNTIGTPGQAERTGAFVIAKGGRILFAHRGVDVSDVVQVDELIRHLA